MSKRAFLAALASVALLAACDKSKEDEVIPVYFFIFRLLCQGQCRCPQD